MRLLRPVIALDPRLFGRRFPGFNFGGEEAEQIVVGEDVRLFLTSFAVGFLFVSVLIF